jgi:hypothetical protein
VTEQRFGSRTGSDDLSDWSRLDMNSLLFLEEEHLAGYDVDLLPPPGTSTSSLVVDVEPEVLDELVREAAASGRTVAEVVQARLRQSAA